MQTVKTIVKSVAAACLLALSSQASQAQSIDFAELFRVHADSVTGEAPDRTLILSGVHISEHSEGGKVRYFAMDHSGLGAVNCIFRILIDTRVATNLCTDIGTKAEVANLDARISQIIPFFARNSFPPIEEAQVRVWVDDRIKAKSEDPATQPRQCLTGQYDNGYRRIFDKLASDEFASTVEEMLSIDRLPVTSPCL